MNEPTRTDGVPSGNILLDIANAFVTIQKEFFGRGPTRARAQVTRDLVVVLLEGGFSRAEQTLHEHGRDDAVNEGRQAMHATIEERCIEAIERLLGRKVYSFMSASDASHELQAELFVLESEDADPPGDAPSSEVEEQPA
jgi:uncharacterized protein YbcI